MIIDKIKKTQNDHKWQLTFVVKQITTPNFLQYIGNEVNFHKDGVSLKTFDSQNSILQDLTSLDLYRIENELLGDIKNIHSFRIALNEKTERIVIESQIELFPNCVSVFGYQEIRLEEGYQVGQKEEDLKKLDYFKRLEARMTETAC